MRTQETILIEIKEKEEELGLYDIKVFNIPLWRLVRFSVRSKKLNKEISFVHRTTKVRLNLLLIIINYVKSFFQLLALIIKGKKYNNIVFAFPRLVKYDAVYFDKFTDPIIVQSNLQNNTLVVQRNLSGKQFTPRLKSSEQLITSDFIDYTSKLFGGLFVLLFFLRYKKSIKDIYNKSKECFELGNKFQLKMAFKIGEFYFMSCFINKLYKSTKCNNIIVVNREIFFPQLSVAKKRNICTFELQHGITHSETVLYTGIYQNELDPDFFLVFGEKWKNKYFGMPINNIKNIGWAYKSWILDKISNSVQENAVLVVSSPEITEQILQVTVELANLYNNSQFTLRLHPQEELSQEQLQKIENVENIKIDDNRIDALISILKHKFCIGKNSSVLYEALDYGRIVGKIMYNGLSFKGSIDKDIENIFYINSPDDFKFFLEQKKSTNGFNLGVYSDFNVQIIENILRK